MNIYKVSEEEMDEKLRLDSRHDGQGFCRCFTSQEELPAGFSALQDEIRNGLEREFWADFDDGVNRTNLKKWQMRINSFFFFPAELLISERIVVEVSNEVLGDQLLGLIRSYLARRASGYCVVVSVYAGMHKDSEYLGRFVINLHEIAVEESLFEFWSKQMKAWQIQACSDGTRNSNLNAYRDLDQR